MKLHSRIYTLKLLGSPNDIGLAYASALMLKQTKTIFNTKQAEEGYVKEIKQSTDGVKEPAVICVSILNITDNLVFLFQLPERAMFQIKQYNPASVVSEWQLEEAQVFWAKKEESLALNILKQMIKKLDTNWFQVCVTLCVYLVGITLFNLIPTF